MELKEITREHQGSRVIWYKDSNQSVGIDSFVYFNSGGECFLLQDSVFGADVGEGVLEEFGKEASYFIGGGGHIKTTDFNCEKLLIEEEEIVEDIKGLHGSYVRCVIQGVAIGKAMIYLHDDEYFLLQNHVSGCRPPTPEYKAFGFNYSWSVPSGSKEELRSNSVKNIVLIGKEVEYQNGQEVDLEVHDFFYSSRLGGKVWEERPRKILIKRLERQGKGYHILSECGLGIYLIV